MSNEGLFTGFTPEQERAYEAEARRRYGDELVAESSRRWKGYGAESASGSCRKAASFIMN